MPDLQMTETCRIDPVSELHETVRCGDFVVIGVQPDNVLEPLTGVVIGSGGNVRSHSVIYAGNVIGCNFQTGHGVMLRESNQIGDNVSIGSHSIVEHHVTIGDGARMHSNVFVPEHTVIEAGVWIGPGVILTNAKYPNTPGAKANLNGAVLRRGCVIGAAVVVLPGVEIGVEAMIGAGAVVTRDVPAGAVVMGEPARVNAAAGERVNQARVIS